MKILKFSIAAILTVGVIYFFSRPIHSGNTTIPPLGDFFNPFTGFWQNLSPDAGTTPEEQDLAELNTTVRVVFDERLVPHIFAENIKDALFVQGYISAKYRLWQMDISSRSAGGQLAEILGSRLLKHDKLQRRKGMLWAAEKTVKSWQNHASFPLIEAYTKGVNAYIAKLSTADYPIEFKLLGYAPSPWSTLKTALFYKSMEETLNSREDDLEATNALAVFGEATYKFLYPERNPKQSPVIPSTRRWNFDTLLEPNNVVPEVVDTFNYKIPEKVGEGIGSNNWAVAGWKTKNGYPILCNDPHLRLNLPSIWFENQIHTPEYNVYGVSFPGVPGIMIGFNENVAFGTTNGGHDVRDWYAIEWANEEKTSYYLDGEKRKVEYRVEHIKLKNGNTITDTVKYTYWGPVVYESDGDAYRDLALRWIAHDTGEDFVWSTFWQFNRAENYQDFINGTDSYGHPIQNFVFASDAGNIGIKVSGLLPLKAKEQGKFIRDGSTKSAGWKGFIPNNQLPQIRNPRRGFVSSANQTSTDTTYPYYYNGVFDDFRGRIINRRLAAMTDITVEDMMQLQTDNYSIEAEELLPLLLQYLDKTKINTVQKGLVKILNEWDYRFEATSMAPVLYTTWKAQFYKMTWDEVYAYKDSFPILYPEIWRTIDLLQNHPLTIFFDDRSTPEREGPQEIATRSFIEMTAVLDTVLSKPGYNWSKHKGSQIMHLARIDAFSVKDFEMGGYREAINAMRHNTGPSWRMIVELGPQTKGWGIYPGGQSGNPGSKYYKNTIKDWAAGRYYELFFMKNADDDRQPHLYTQIFK